MQVIQKEKRKNRHTSVDMWMRDLMKWPVIIYWLDNLPQTQQDKIPSISQVWSQNALNKQ